VPPKIITHIEDNSDALFYANILSQARGAAAGDMSAMPDGLPLWVPVTREQFITGIIRNRKKDVEKQRVEDGPRQLAELERLLLSRLREEYQRLSPSERASPAWRLQSPDGFSGLAPAGATNARGMMTLNPNYFDMSRPRSDIQLISVTLNSQNETRTGPNFVTSAVRLDEFQATADWARIASFVEPAR